MLPPSRQGRRHRTYSTQSCTHYLPATTSHPPEQTTRKTRLDDKHSDTAATPTCTHATQGRMRNAEGEAPRGEMGPRMRNRSSRQAHHLDIGCRRPSAKQQRHQEDPHSTCQTHHAQDARHTRSYRQRRREATQMHPITRRPETPLAHRRCSQDRTSC